MEIALSGYFCQIPVLSNCKPEQFRVEKLPGFTNLNYRITNHEHDWILRIPKPETNAHISREQEKHNHNIAVELGFVPKPFWRNNAGMSLTATLPNSRTANLHDLRPGKTVDQLLLNLYRLHHCRKPFHGEVNLADSLHQYFKSLPVHSRRQLQGNFEKAKSKLSEIDDRHDYRVPSHNDLVLGNLLIENRQKIWLIDWEYSAMASPYWDLASLCNAARYSQSQSEKLLQGYNALGAELGGEYLHNYRYALQMLSICWLKQFTRQDINIELYQLQQLDN